MQNVRLNQSRVIFHLDTHRYCTPEGKELSGVTSLLNRHIFTDKYNDVPEHVLQRAALKGSYIHELCQQYDEFGVKAGQAPELESYIRMRKEYEIVPVASEYLVSDNQRYATMIDMVSVGERGFFDLNDFKTTCKIDQEYLSWQLSINAYLFERQNPYHKVGRLYGIWLRGEDSRRVEVVRKPEYLIERLFECDSAGDRFLSDEQALMLPDEQRGQVVKIAEVEAFIIDLKQQVERAVTVRDKMLEMILSSMERNGQKSIETDRLRITRMLPTEKQTFDSKALKEHEPEIYAKYLKISPIKGSVKITLKK